MNEIAFDPRMFVSPPFIICPKCGANSFGILMVGEDKYFRRCRECFHPGGYEPPASYQLPELNKKVIYIDQFAISNMMKALNPQTKAYQKGMDPFWRKLFDRLYFLGKLQLTICPDSYFHVNESLLSEYYRPLKRMYELLSHGVTFYDHETIKTFQIRQHAKNWISGKTEERFNLNVQSIVHGRINAWSDKFIITGNLNYDTEWIDTIRKERQRVSEGLRRVFKFRKEEKDRAFNDWFEEEWRSFGRAVLMGYDEYVKKVYQVQAGNLAPTLENLIKPFTVTILYTIRDIFRKAGVQDSDIWKKVIEYLVSDSLKEISFNKISSLLFAALARKAAAGQRREPSQGMSTDIEIISVLMPYCDAMFVDNECYALLSEKPLCDDLGCETKIFSLNNKESFMKYLDDLEKSVPADHIQKVEEVYGNSWRKPYATLYTKGVL